MGSFQPTGSGAPSVPQSMNTPLQVMGGNGHDMSAAALDFSFDQYGDETNEGFEDRDDAKRRRIARACDMCRKKKIKCDGKMPACTHCINYKTECVFTHVEKKRAAPKGAKYIEGLENRLGRMEALLRLSGLLSDEDVDRTDLSMLEKRLVDKTNERSRGTTPSDTPRLSISQPRSGSGSNFSPQQANKLPSPQSSVASPRPPEENKPEEEVEALSDMMCSLVTNNCGETRYIGSSSGFSIFSPKGIQWINEKTGDNSFQEMISKAAVDDTKWVYWRPEIFSDMFARRTFMTLPPQHEALSLCKDFFDNFNCMFPLFHEPTFMHLVNRQYSRQPYEGSGWWASFNIALAIAHRIRVMSNLVPQEEDNKAWMYLKNAMGVLTELTMRNLDLLSVQALLGMAMFLLGTPNPQPSFFLVAAAIRLANSIGLHKRGSGFNLNPVEIEQRKRVFWIGYLLDKDICLRSGRPPAQDDDDMNVELPSEDPIDNIGNIPLADGKGKTNLFRLMCSFAVIESKVYKQLYSTKASKQSDGALLNTIGELDKELEEWKDAIPIDIRPEHEIKAAHPPLVLHIVVLHFTYYNCLTTIHRMSVHHGYWTNRLSNYAIQGLNARPLNPRVFSSAALCVQAARASIHLIKYIPQGDYSCVWLILYFPVSALVTLFANILQNPQDPRARSDVRLMNQVVNFLSLLAVTEEQGGVKRMLGVCVEFERIAKVVLDRAEKDSHSRRKRKSNRDGDEPIPTPNPGAHKRNAPLTPTSQNQQHSPNLLSPNLTTPDLSHQSFNPNLNGFTPGLSNEDISVPLDFSGLLNPPSTMPSAFSGSDLQQFGNGETSSLNVGSFQQPFVPQDLWQMPQTLEWDWADMNNIGFPAFDGQAEGLNPPYGAGPAKRISRSGSGATQQYEELDRKYLADLEPERKEQKRTVEKIRIDHQAKVTTRTHSERRIVDGVRMATRKYQVALEKERKENTRRLEALTSMHEQECKQMKEEFKYKVEHLYDKTSKLVVEKTEDQDTVRQEYKAELEQKQVYIEELETRLGTAKEALKKKDMASVREKEASSTDTEEFKTIDNPPDQEATQGSGPQHLDRIAQDQKLKTKSAEQAQLIMALQGSLSSVGRQLTDAKAALVHAKGFQTIPSSIPVVQTARWRTRKQTQEIQQQRLSAPQGAPITTPLPKPVHELPLAMRDMQGANSKYVGKDPQEQPAKQVHNGKAAVEGQQPKADGKKGTNE
ncbi:MAG: hypothetical protein Q9166_008088 [cf. Caloplaca sp. 2 TL-2023]